MKTLFKVIVATYLVGALASSESALAAGKKRPDPQANPVGTVTPAAPKPLSAEAKAVKAKGMKVTLREMAGDLSISEREANSSELNEYANAEIGRTGSERMKWESHRCSTYGDSLGQPQAIERMLWAKRCLAERVSDKTFSYDQRKVFDHILKNLDEVGVISGDGVVRDRETQRPVYPVFGVVRWEHLPVRGGLPGDYKITNPLGWTAPTDRSASCDLWPRDYTLVGVCVGGCFTPEQVVLFDNGYFPIGDAVAIQGELTVKTLAPASELDALSYKQTAIRSITKTDDVVQHEILMIETGSGKSVRVTTNHPMLLATGEMVEAKTLKIGQLLVQESGAVDPISKIVGQSYVGRVYNVDVKSADLKENIIVAQGLLTGSIFYQNEGKEHLSRKLFRTTLPESLVK